MKIWYLILRNLKLFPESADNWVTDYVRDEKPKHKFIQSMMCIELVQLKKVNEMLHKAGIKFIFIEENNGSVTLKERIENDR